MLVKCWDSYHSLSVRSSAYRHWHIKKLIHRGSVPLPSENLYISLCMNLSIALLKRPSSVYHIYIDTYISDISIVSVWYVTLVSLRGFTLETAGLNNGVRPSDLFFKVTEFCCEDCGMSFTVAAHSTCGRLGARATYNFYKVLLKCVSHMVPLTYFD